MVIATQAVAAGSGSRRWPHEFNSGLQIRVEAEMPQANSRSGLTKREREVLTLVAEGNSNKRVAHHLKISERTVKNHMFYIMTKLRAMDRTHAVVRALRLGWIDLSLKV